MARFVGLFFALALSKHFLFRVTEQHKCSSSSGISGCECLFLGACNAVPQFGDYNSVPWRIAEGALVGWFSKNCASNGKQNSQMFIIVGVTPSTMLGPSRTPRYFGKEGFSDYQDDTNYRVNVPAEMWTAACCTFIFTEDSGQS